MSVCGIGRCTKHDLPVERARLVVLDGAEEETHVRVPQIPTLTHGRYIARP